MIVLDTNTTDEYIFDVEGDGLLDTITKIHCLSYSSADGLQRGSLIEKSDIEDFFNQGYCYIGHYITGYDFKALKKIYNIERPKNFVDTLGLAWYLDLGRESFGLESYGEELGVKKPLIKDWVNLSLDDYMIRCETDVEINRLLWIKQKNRLMEIYE